MSTRIICPDCNYANSKHRRTCKKCRLALDQDSLVLLDSTLPSEPVKSIQAAQVATKEGFQKDIWVGLLWVIGGILVTAGTYSAAAPGETYIVAWGAILFGGIQFLKGVFNSLTR